MRLLCGHSTVQNLLAACVLYLNFFLHAAVAWNKNGLCVACRVFTPCSLCEAACVKPAGRQACGVRSLVGVVVLSHFLLFVISRRVLSLTLELCLIESHDFHFLRADSFKKRKVWQPENFAMYTTQHIKSSDHEH